jgi:putative oxidoreductase
VQTLSCVNKASEMSEAELVNERIGHGTLTEAGRLLLRLMLGGLLLCHGISKIIYGIDSITTGISRAGLPGALGYLVYVGEVVAPALLIFGIWTRIGALLVVVNMLVAIALAHSGQLFSLSKSGGYGLELQAFYLFTAVAVAMLGAGRFSLGGKDGHWN